MRHRFELRVYYEDTDLAGVVYYANYLKFIERARTEFIRELGIDQVVLKRDAGLVLVVRRLVCDFLSPARFDDLIHVETRPLACSGARVELGQDILRERERLFTASVTLACMNAAGAPARVPEAIRSGLDAFGCGLDVRGRAG